MTESQQFHITIKGQPFCEWTGCAAHRQVANQLMLRHCDYGDLKAADHYARALAKTVKGVALAYGPCPSLDGECA